jgi:hypothetical protein
MAARDGANVSLDLDMSALIRGTAKLDDRLDRAVAGVVKQRSHIAEGWMKKEAPWTDQTGNARSGLRSTTEHVPKVVHIINLFHSVSYGIWLEVRFQGRYSIVIPAILDQGVKLMATLNKVMARMGSA